MESNGDIVYETLDAISLFSNPDPENDLSDSYAVFRNQITSSTDLSTVIPVVDYISLNVLADTPRREIQEISPLTSVDRSNEGCNASELTWFRAASRFKSPMIQLHKEILDFCDFVSPTPEEQSSRAAAMQGVVEVVKCIWPHCKVEVFGSFRTGLYIPTSDIDVVVFESRVRTPQIGLYALAKALSQRNIAKKMQVISKARVPIIKFVEKQSGIAFDISFDIDGGPKAADFIKDAVRKLPPLRPLCLILKVFLHQRELNEVYSGGIGSYTLLAMLIAHLQLHWRGQDIQRCQKSMEHNLGILLVSFLDFYGCKLNTLDVGVSCNLPGTFFLKTDKGFLNAKRPRLLSVEDPQAPDNDIARNSFNYYKVRTAFSMAYARLTDAKAITGSSSHKSILGTIIRPDPLLLNRRGGTNGELTFVDLLPGADESPSRQFGDEINGDGNLLSSRKRKAKREKRKMRKSFDGGEALDRVNEANGTTQTRSAKKKRRRRAFQEHDERFFKSVPRYSSRSRRSVTVIQLTGKRTTMRI